MQMTEAFATTVASVSSAILIAATLEAAAVSRAIQDWTRAAFDSFWSMKVELASVTPSERRAALQAFKVQRLPKYGVGAAKSLLFLATGLVWGLIMVAQAAAIVLCLVWLADPKEPKEVEAAEVLAFVVAAGALAVAVVPICRVLYSPLGPLAERWLELKLQEVALQDSEESAGESQADGLEPRQLPGPRERDEATAGDTEAEASS
ncbi:hypothetical protein ACQF36_29475 [Streptomyces sp. Marseille-Q5077]|uniref:hypothetical protein n=1 Tax=Streptomyces sp. Marseille-Q5077 TaxID=3418995 RepID=UPI003D00B207